MIDKYNNQAVVIGHNHYNTLGLLRSLGEAGISPTLILISSNLKDSFVAKSKYIGELFLTEETGLINVLKAIKDNNNRPVIFPTSDRIANLLDLNYSALNEYYHLPNINKTPCMISLEMDKEQMRKNAENCGFKVPKSVIVRKGDVRIDCEYPCIIKTVNSASGKKDYGVYTNPSELNVGLTRMFEYTDIVQIQQYLRKSKEIIYLGWSHDGHVCIPCLMTKVREYPENFGCTGLGLFSPDVNRYFDIEKLKHLIKSYNYSGLFSVEFIICDETPYFLEINFRNDGNGYFPGFTGVETNLPYNYIKAVKYGIFDNENSVISNSFQMMRELTDFSYVRSTGYSWLRWLSDIKKTEAFQIWNRNDNAPFRKVLLNRILRK